MMSEINLKSITTLIAVLGLVFGVFQFIHVQKIAATKPFLERKLAWCEEIVETTSYIATSKTDSEPQIRRFWQMYWGVMGLVEKEEILDAMVAFGKELESKKALKSKSLDIAHACRGEFEDDWSSSWAM